MYQVEATRSMGIRFHMRFHIFAVFACACIRVTGENFSQGTLCHRGKMFLEDLFYRGKCCFGGIGPRWLFD